jgi:hypothetical protein
MVEISKYGSGEGSGEVTTRTYSSAPGMACSLKK